MPCECDCGIGKEWNNSDHHWINSAVGRVKHSSSMQKTSEKETEQHQLLIQTRRYSVYNEVIRSACMNVCLQACSRPVCCIQSCRSMWDQEKKMKGVWNPETYNPQQHFLLFMYLDSKLFTRDVRNIKNCLGLFLKWKWSSHTLFPTI